MVFFGHQKQLDHSLLRHSTTAELFASDVLKIICQLVNRLVLRPKIGLLVSAAVAERNQVIDLELHAVAAIDLVTVFTVVTLNHFPFLVTVHIAITGHRAACAIARQAIPTVGARRELWIWMFRVPLFLAVLIVTGVCCE